jgi:hypothetical protein
MNNHIDITFDFRTDTPEGKDPDTWSPTLVEYHRLLWGKPLPGGGTFELEPKPKPPYYLHHCSQLGEFWLSSDAVMPTFQWSETIRGYMTDQELEDFRRIGYTIGAMMIFPAIQIDRKWTINQTRGCLRKIRDRFDLTLECVRRHYLGEESPMSKVLARYGDFFDVFGDFRGYVDHFLLQDLVTEDYNQVRLFHPNDDFKSLAVPQTKAEYLRYKDLSIAFIHARNRRSLNWVKENQIEKHK